MVTFIFAMLLARSRAELRSFALVRLRLCTSEVFPQLLPQAKSSKKGVGIVAGAGTRGQLFQLLDVASTKDHFVRFEGSSKALHHVRNITPPFLLAMLLQASNSDVILK